MTSTTETHLTTEKADTKNHRDKNQFTERSEENTTSEIQKNKK